MNVLFVTYDFPFPIASGGKNRAFHLLKHTANNTNIHLFSFVREDYNPENNEEILNLGVKSIKVLKRRKLKSVKNILPTVLNSQSIFKTLYEDQEAINEIFRIVHDEKIDIIHYESSYVGFLMEGLKHLRVKHILGTENIEFTLYQDYEKNMNKALLKPIVRWQSERLKNEEIAMIKLANNVTVVTPDEAKLVESMTGVKSKIVANGIETKSYQFESTKKSKNNILFVGNFSYFPNVDAVNFFYNEVFKNYKKDITFTIVGKESTGKFQFTDTRVIIKDFVEDIIEEYRNADLFIFPIRIGGGTNFKVLEAMSLGLPIVAQPERLRGLGAKDSIHFLKAEDPKEYMEKIDLLYNDEGLRNKITKNARQLIVENFEWNLIGKKLIKVWKNSL